MCATSFLPFVGGLEIVSDMVAHALAAAGHDVTVLTLENGPAMPERGYRLVRRPGFGTALRVLRAADVVVMQNVGLKMLPPVLLSGTPLVVWHHSELGDGVDRHAMRKRWVMRHLVAANLGCSDYVTANLPDDRPRATLCSPYDPERMFEEPGVVRDGELVMLGRLVSDKGFDVALRALALPGGPLGDARVTIVGDGPERVLLEALVVELGIAERVTFAGRLGGGALRHALNAHKVLVVPSVWQEPFGIVALEGLACGCSVVVSAAGGLPQAGGPTARTFRPGDPEDAARAIAEALAAPRDPAPEARLAHLAAQRADAVAARLVALIAPHARKPARKAA